MIRTFLAAVFALVLTAGGLFAGEVKGKFVKFDAEKKVLTLSVDGKDTDLTVTADSKFGKKQTVLDVFGKKAPKAGVEFIAVTEKKDGKEVVTELKRAPK
jgi:hypothetical protein